MLRCSYVVLLFWISVLLVCGGWGFLSWCWDLYLCENMHVGRMVLVLVEGGWF